MENADIVWVGDQNQVAVVVTTSYMTPLPEEVRDEIIAHCQKTSEDVTVVFRDSAQAREIAEKLIVSAVHVGL